MHIKDLYSVVVTDKHRECRDFYVAPDHPSQPPGPETFAGKGVFLTIQVADAAAEFARLRQNGLSITYPLRDEPWGQRRFAVQDPAGTWVDVVEHIEPAPGYWDKYVSAPDGLSPHAEHPSRDHHEQRGKDENQD